MATSASSVPARLIEFFIAEAVGYADTLREIMWLPAGERDTAQMVAAARALRGSATMVRLSDLAVVAGRLERIARGIHTRRMPWTEPLAYSLQAVLYELPELISAAAVWGPGESERAGAIADALQAFAPADDRKTGSMIIPIARLFHDDPGPHIIYVAVTPQTQFEQQLREPAPDAGDGAGARPTRARPEVRQPQTPRPTYVPSSQPVQPPAQSAAAPAPEPARTDISAAAPARSVPTAPPPRPIAEEERTPPRGKNLRSLISEGLAGFAGMDLETPATPAATADSLIPIESLLYTGRAALARAREIRAAQAAAAREPTPEELDELMDLMELATSA